MGKYSLNEESKRFVMMLRSTNQNIISQVKRNFKLIIYFMLLLEFFFIPLINYTPHIHDPQTLKIICKTMVA